MVSFMHEQNSICSQKQLNDIAHEQTIICRQLFAGHVVDSRPMKRKKHLHQMIIHPVCPPGAHRGGGGGSGGVGNKVGVWFILMQVKHFLQQRFCFWSRFESESFITRK